MPFDHHPEKFDLSFARQIEIIYLRSRTFFLGTYEASLDKSHERLKTHSRTGLETNIRTATIGLIHYAFMPFNSSISGSN